MRKHVRHSSLAHDLVELDFGESLSAPATTFSLFLAFFLFFVDTIIASLLISLLRRSLGCVYVRASHCYFVYVYSSKENMNCLVFTPTDLHDIMILFGLRMCKYNILGLCLVGTSGDTC